jgi:hypothetical protein
MVQVRRDLGALLPLPVEPRPQLEPRPQRFAMDAFKMICALRFANQRADFRRCAAW